MSSKNEVTSYLGSLKDFTKSQQNRMRYAESTTNKHSIMRPSISNISVLPIDSQNTRDLRVKLKPETRKPTTSQSMGPNTAATVKRYPKITMSITEGRGVAAEVGLCIFDANSCEVVLSQFADTQTFDRTLQKIHLNEPQKILVPISSMEGITGVSNKPSKLCQLIMHNFPNVVIIPLPRKYFNDEIGKKNIYDYGLQEDTIGLLFGVSTKYFCLAALSGVFQHVLKNESNAFMEHTIKFIYQGAEGIMLIDTVTAKNLELIANTTHPHTHNTLFGILNRTLTPMGKRLLRMNILQPPCTLAVIKDRLDAVEELSTSEECIFNIQSCLKYLTDLDYTIAYLVKIHSDGTSDAKNALTSVKYAEMKINQVISLKQTIKCIREAATHLPPKAQDYEDTNGQILLNKIYKILSSSVFADLENIIDEYINDEVGIQNTSLGIRNQKCYAVKAGVNGLLDVARQTYKETTEDIYEVASSYVQTFGMHVKLQFSASGGFYLTMAQAQFKKNGGTLPEEFINVIKKKKVLQFTTMELMQKNRRIEESLTEVYLMSDRIVTELLQTFRSNINMLYKVSEAIALLDMLTSLAACNVSSGYVRPEFSDTIAIKSGRHPILDHILSFPLVPNDSFASLSSSFQFITGPNMSGKSTYLRQIAMLTIMAQVGSFVPAEYASFRISDQLLSRLANDNTFTDIGTSSFMSEMRETAYLLQHVTNNSIVIIDELGRGTSPSDALCIAGAVCEELIHTRAFCFFATHLHELTRTLDIYPNVVNLQFKVDVNRQDGNTCSLSYQYIIEDGRLESEQHYGLRTAQVLGLPKEIISCAYNIVKLKTYKDQFEENRRSLQKQISEERKLLWFADKILQFGQVHMSKEQLHEQLDKLKQNILDEEGTN